MRFAAFTTVADAAGEATTAADLLDNLREQTILAEQMGFEAMWLGEHHFGPYETGDIPTPSCSVRTWRHGRRRFGSVKWRTSLRGGTRFASPRM